MGRVKDAKALVAVAPLVVRQAPRIARRTAPRVAGVADRLAHDPHTRQAVADVRQAFATQGVAGVATRVAHDPDVRRAATAMTAALGTAVARAGRPPRRRWGLIAVSALALVAVGAGVVALVGGRRNDPPSPQQSPDA